MPVPVIGSLCDSSAPCDPGDPPSPAPPPSGFAGTDCHGPMDPPKIALTGKG
jgi:hypothetical protein